MPVALPVREFSDPAAPSLSPGEGRGTPQRPRRPRRHLRVLPPPAPTAPPSQLLRLLTVAQRGSMVVATALVGLALLSYGVSVSLDRQLKATSTRLNQVQKNQQQLTSVNEVLKHYLARQAEASSPDLMPPSPHSVIFLPPADVPPTAAPAPVAAPPPRSLRPLGY